MFSRLRREGDKPTRRRSPVSTIVFTRLGHRDGNVFTHLGERRKNVHSRLGPEVVPRRRHASERMSASSNKSAKDLNHRNKDARSLICSYVTCSSECQREIEEEWSNGEDDLSQPWLCEETDPFTARIWYFKVPKKTRMPSNVKTYDGTGDPEDHLKYFQAAAKIERWAMPTWCHMFNSTLIGSARTLSKGEVAAANQSRKKAQPTWRHHETNHKPSFDKRPDFKSQYKVGRRQDRFTPLTKTPKEILAMVTVKFKAPPPMTGPVENQNKNKFCKFHGDKGHNMDECIHLRRHIEEAVRSGQLSHLVKEIKQGGKQGEHAKDTKKGETPNKEKATTIFMVQPWQRMTRQKTTQSFFAGREISFSPLEGSGRQENPIVIEAEVEGHLIHRMYVDRGSASEVLYEHCFNKLRPEINQMIPATTPLIGFSGKISWPLGQISLMVSLGDGEHSTSTSMNFMVVRSPSPYNGIIDRPSLRKIQAVPSTAHGMLKFLVEGGIVTIRSSTIILTECRMVAGAPNGPPPQEPTATEGIKVAIHPEYPEQTVTIGGSLSEKGRMELCNLLKENLDIFAWKPADMTGVPRSIAEHRLNIHEGCQPIRQKRRGQASDTNKAIQAEVAKLVEAEIIREVYYYDWLSNPVMVKSTMAAGGSLSSAIVAFCFCAILLTLLIFEHHPAHEPGPYDKQLAQAQHSERPKVTKCQSLCKEPNLHTTARSMSSAIPQGAKSAHRGKQQELRSSARNASRVQSRATPRQTVTRYWTKKSKRQGMRSRGRTSMFQIGITDDDNDNPSNYATKGDGITDVDLTATTLLSTR
ncbi:reverse transcriptase domain-containing protein [Tanacetum coccineum]